MPMFRFMLISICAVVLSACAEWGTLTKKGGLVDADTMARAKAASSLTPATAAQREMFGVLAGFPGRTFRGEPTSESAEALADFQHWAWTDDGEGLIIRHALEDGSYGGESIVRRDDANGQLTYVYNTNAGFSTEGTFTVNADGTWAAEEEVSGRGEVKKVRSRGEILPSGAMVSVSEYYANGRWTKGHSFEYREVWQDLPELQSPIAAAE